MRMRWCRISKLSDWIQAVSTNSIITTRHCTREITVVGPTARRTRSAWEDPPPKPVEPEVEEAPASEAPSVGDPSTSAAYDPVTGEINWDCSCLGGMAHGPCGPEFREAFSCFIYSEEEPKGINCVEKFKGMQDCFRAHPDVYGEGTLFGASDG